MTSNWRAPDFCVSDNIRRLLLEGESCNKTVPVIYCSDWLVITVMLMTTTITQHMFIKTKKYVGLTLSVLHSRNYKS